MKKPFTKSDYKRKRREVKRTSQKLNSPKYLRKFKIGDIVKLKSGVDDMGYVEQYRYDNVLVKWTLSVGYHMEDELVKVA